MLNGHPLQMFGPEGGWRDHSMSVSYRYTQLSFHVAMHLLDGLAPPQLVCSEPHMQAAGTCRLLKAAEMFCLGVGRLILAPSLLGRACWPSLKGAYSKQQGCDRFVHTLLQWTLRGASVRFCEGSCDDGLQASCRRGTTQAAV
jgi:hypothetical protein